MQRWRRNDVAPPQSLAFRRRFLFAYFASQDARGRGTDEPARLSVRNAAFKLLQVFFPDAID